MALGSDKCTQLNITTVEYSIKNLRRYGYEVTDTQSCTVEKAILVPFVRRETGSQICCGYQIMESHESPS